MIPILYIVKGTILYFVLFDSCCVVLLVLVL